MAVFRAEEGWFALDAACPHRGGPLADGILASRTVICPLHERRFDLGTGEERSSGSYCVATHRVEVRGADVYLEAPARTRHGRAAERQAGPAAAAAAAAVI
jgi:nitrite reductase (NADH) small subunit